MSEIDAESFVRQVLENVKSLESRSIKFAKIDPNMGGSGFDIESIRAELQAERVVTNPDSNRILRERLCPLLRTISGDAFEIAKVSTPVLIGLATTGAVNLPLSPLVFAAVCLFLARGGTSVLCGESKPQEKK